MGNSQEFTIEYKIIDTFDWEFGHRDNFGDELMDKAEIDLKELHNLNDNWYAVSMGVNIVGTGFDAKFLVSCEFLEQEGLRNDEGN